MPKKAGIVILALGAVLIFAALLLLLYNRQESTLAGQEAESLLSEVESAIAERTSNPTATTTPTAQTNPPDGDSALESPETEPTLPQELPTVMIWGYGYVGYLEIPALNIRLPVMGDWDYDRLKISPCRQYGSSRTDDLVIAAHNYSSHFGRLKTLAIGDSVQFTDMDGISNAYLVEKVDTVDPYDVDTVLNSGYDLVLYTCTIGGRTRVTVFCNRIPETLSP